MSTEGHRFGPWHAWDGSAAHGPDFADLELVVQVRRRGPNAVGWEIDEAHHIEWTWTGGPEDVVNYRAEKIDADYYIAAVRSLAKLRGEKP